MRLDPIHIQPYDPRWADSFAQQRDRIEAVLGPRLSAPVEHIGSTAVPGLPAKPIIDMLALVEDYDAAGPGLADLERIGWVPAPEPGDRDRRRWCWCYPSIAERTHHLHVVERSSSSWPDWIRFRDHLRTHPADAQRYAALKRDLAAADDRDRVRYRAGKEPLIHEILARAQLGSAADPRLRPGRAEAP